MLKFGLVGKSIGYSYSNNLFFEVFADDPNLDYLIYDTDKIEKSKLLKFNGLNVTTPYKKVIINYLDEIDELANEIQSVNCLKIENQKIKGYNTDYYGFSKSLETFPNIKTMLLLGNGGVSSTIEKYCKDHNINLTICARRTSKSKFDICYEDLEDLNFDCIVNATKFGVLPPIKYENIPTGILLFDLCYSFIPNEPTDFIYECIKYGNNKNTCLDGSTMLYNQAIQSYKIWGLI